MRHQQHGPWLRAWVAKRRQRPFNPTGRTTSSRPARSRLSKFSRPISVSSVTEVHNPAAPNQAGRCSALAKAAMSTDTPITTKPCPSENNIPIQRAKRGRRSALKRTRPLMVAR